MYNTTAMLTFYKNLYLSPVLKKTLSLKTQFISQY